MKTKRQKESCSGMTLIEVVAVTMIVTLVLLGVIASVMMGNHMNYANGQKVAAFGLCREWYEQMKGVQFFTNITTEVFAPQEVRISHMGGRYRLPLMGQRDCTIVDLLNPERKQVTVRVSWTFQDKEQQETLQGVIYRKR